MGYESTERRKVNVLEMKCLRIWLECHEWIEFGIERELASRADQSIKMVWACEKNG